MGDPGKAKSSGRGWLPYAVALASLLLTALATLALENAARVRARAQFQVTAQRGRDSLERRLENHIAVLRGIAAFFAAHNAPVTREDFHAYVSRLDLPRRYPGIQGVGFSKRLWPEEVRDPRALARRTGGPLRLWPEHERDEYHAILFLEPLDRRNEAALGYDMFTDDVRREAMERARDTGEPAASGPVELVQEIDENKQTGFLIYLPVYRGGDPGDAAGRAARLEGFVYSPLRIGDLLAATFDAERTFEITLWDASAGSQYRLGSTYGEKMPPGRFHEELPIDVAGRRWVVGVESRRDFEQAAGQWLVPWVAGAGLVVSGLLFGVTRAQARARSRAEFAAAEARIASDAQRQSEARLRRLVDSNIIGVIIGHHPRGPVMEVNDAYLRLIGYTREDFEKGRINWEALTPEEYREADRRAVDRLRVEGQHAPIEKEYVRKDGTRVPLLMGRTLVDAAGGLIAGFAVDLTERKRQERELVEHVRVTEILHRTAATLAAEVEHEKIVEAVVEGATSASGAQFGAFFYNVINQDGEAYTLYKIAGVPRERFDKFPMPRNTEIFGPTFRGERTVRYDDVTKEPAYGKNAPYHGMPEGHLPVRSYLAAPVVSRSGEVHGGIFLGHERVGVFTVRHEAVAVGLAAQAAVAIDNARLYEALRRGEEQYRFLAESIPNIVWTATPAGDIDYYNQRWYEYTGLSEKISHGWGWSEATHPDDLPGMNERVNHCIRTGDPFSYELRLKRARDGAYRWHLTRALPLRDGEGKIVRWFGTCTDIDDRKRAEQALRQMNETLEQRVEERTAELRDQQRRLRELASELTLVEQRERRRIAEGLHDHLGQVLAAAKMRLSLPQADTAAVRELLDEAIRSTRALTFELSPPILYQMGLAPAVRWLAQQMRQQHGMEVTVETHGDAEPAAEDLKVLLFQSVRELLINVLKHANVREARVTLAREGDDLRLTVEDRGRGFAQREPGKAPAGGGGFGLFNLAERWHMLGGSFAVTSQPGGGTRVTLVAPLREATRNAKGVREDADPARR